MKTIIFSFVLLINVCVCLSLASCSKDDVEPTSTLINQSPTLDKSSITLYVDETSVITYSGKECTWSTDNSLIAMVDNGKVTAKHVGTTIIHANNLTCTVTVKPRYNTYTEPYLNFGCSKSEVKTKMSAYNMKSEDATRIVYYGKGKINTYGYAFENDKLINSVFYTTLINSIELTDFLLERYWVIDYEDKGNNEYIFYLGSVDLKTYVVMQLTTSGSIVMYLSADSVSNSQNGSEIKARIKKALSKVN